MPDAARTQAPRAPLRVGLFAGALAQPRWLAAAFARVAATEFAEIVLLSTGSAAPPVMSWPRRLYDWLDRKLFGTGPDLSASIDLRAGLPATPFLALPAELDSAAGDAWRAEILAQRLDVVFALDGLDDAVLQGLARYGVWRYRYGEGLDRVEADAGVREVTTPAPVTASALTARPGSGAPERLVYQSWSRTQPYSIARNRDNLQRKAIAFVSRALEQLHRRGPDWMARLPTVPGEGIPAAPGESKLLGGFCKLATRMARRGAEKLLTVDQWFVGYRFGTDERWTGDLRPYARLMPPKDRYWADPFALERAGRHYIFFEEYMLAAAKAHLMAVEVGRGGERGVPVRVLERPYHLSYPFLIEEGGELFMIPETGANRTVEIYRCHRFPDDWRLEKVLLRGARFVDATVHRAGDRWWMFVNAGADGTELHDELYLYHADSLLGEWRPHPANPLKSDARSARPAGRLFEREGALYRPAQICAPLYGSGISINRVLRLDPLEYVEREEERIYPEHPAGLLGLHTVNRAGELAVIDGFLRRSRVAFPGRTASEPARLVPLHRTITEHADN
jgi:hypothetical protein